MHIYIQNEVKNEIASISVFKKQVLFIKIANVLQHKLHQSFTSTNFDWLKLACPNRKVSQEPRGGSLSPEPPA